MKWHTARATVSREYLLDWSSTRRNLHCLRGTLPGPKGRDFTWKDGAGWMIIWHGGQLYLQVGFFFENISIKTSKWYLIQETIHFLEGIPIPDLRKKTYIKQSNTANTYFTYFHPCVVSVNDRRRFRSWSNRKGTLCDFLATAISSLMRVRGRQDENYSVGKGQLRRKRDDFKVTAFCWEDLVGFDNNLIHFAFLGTNSICYN